MFNVESANTTRLWIEARSETQVSHLRHCSLVPANVKQRIVDEAASSQAQSQMTPRAQRINYDPQAYASSQAASGVIASPRPIHAVGQQLAAPVFIAEWQQQATSMVPHPSRPQSSASMHLGVPMNIFEDPNQMQPSPVPTTISMGTTTSLHSAGSFSNRPAKLVRVASGLKRPSSAFGNQALPWSPERQQLFENAIARTTASAGEYKSYKCVHLLIYQQV